MSESIVLERSLLPVTGPGLAGLRRRRVYIFLTRHGLLFGFTLFIMLLGAVNYSNSLAFLLTFLLAALFLVCMLHTYRNLRGLVIRLADAEPVFAGEIAAFPVLLDNRAAPARTALSVIPYLPPAAGRKRRRTAADRTNVDVAADALHRLPVEVAAARRGVLRIERFRLESTWPLGLFRAWSYLDGPSTCVIYPRPAGRAELPASEEFEAENLTGRRTGTDDFIGFRDYRPGDSIRSIDWKALARERGLLVKRFVGSGTRRLTLRWDATDRHADTEQRLSQLCRWVLEAERQGLHYALQLPGAALEHGTGTAHRNSCLEALARHGT